MPAGLYMASSFLAQISLHAYHPVQYLPVDMDPLSRRGAPGAAASMGAFVWNTRKISAFQKVASIAWSKHMRKSGAAGCHLKM